MRGWGPQATLWLQTRGAGYIYPRLPLVCSHSFLLRSLHYHTNYIILRGRIILFKKNSYHHTLFMFWIIECAGRGRRAWISFSLVWLCRLLKLIILFGRDTTQTRIFENVVSSSLDTFALFLLDVFRRLTAFNVGLFFSLLSFPAETPPPGAH